MYSMIVNLLYEFWKCRVDKNILAKHLYTNMFSDVNKLSTNIIGSTESLWTKVAHDYFCTMEHKGESCKYQIICI